MSEQEIEREAERLHKIGPTAFHDAIVEAEKMAQSEQREIFIYKQAVGMIVWRASFDRPNHLPCIRVSPDGTHSIFGPTVAQIGRAIA